LYQNPTETHAVAVSNDATTGRMHTVDGRHLEHVF
jgi:hypothetical protein